MPPVLDKWFKRKASVASAPTPKRFDALYAKAAGAAEAHDFERAIQLCDEAIAVDSSRAEPYYKRANSLKNLGRLREALASYDQAIERNTDYACAYCNRGTVQHSLGLMHAALSSYDKAIALDPTDVFAHYNRALLLQDCSRWEDALASYDRAIAIQPEFADAHCNRALALLFQGDFASGWRAFEWRWKNARRLRIGDARTFTQPLWLGVEPLAGKRLLLYCEGGLGDTVQFCRYATMSAALGATVLLEAQAPLIGVLGSLQGVSQLIARGSPLPAFDYQCPLMSLPLAFKTTLDTVPAAPRYLHSDAARIAQWRVRLGERSRLRIGLAWSGNLNNPLDPSRSVRLGDWVAHLPPQFEYFRLQTQVRAADQAVLDSSPLIFSFDDDLMDFTNTAALCECLDLVISVDTSLAHLSGALGQRTWVLLPYTPDWRWLRDRDDSPWYPTMRLYRQPAVGAWDEVFARVSADLQRESGIS